MHRHHLCHIVSLWMLGRYNFPEDSWHHFAYQSTYADIHGRGQYFQQCKPSRIDRIPTTMYCLRTCIEHLHTSSQWSYGRSWRSSTQDCLDCRCWTQAHWWSDLQAMNLERKWHWGSLHHRWIMADKVRRNVFSHLRVWACSDLSD